MRAPGAPRSPRVLGHHVIVITGFIAGGIALPIGPAWWLFWTGAGIVMLGFITGAAVHIFDDWY